MHNKIKVLVVDDSAVTRTVLIQLLDTEPDIHVIGAVDDGQAAIDLLNRGPRPDIVVMDIHMPRLDGFEATRLIMESRHPLPIVICTATADPRELAIAFQSLEAGALACVKKPVALGPDFEERRKNLLQNVRLMSEIRVVRRWNRAREPSQAQTRSHTRKPRLNSPSFKLVGIGASTGGPPVLQTILSSLPRSFPVPLVIVQHIAPGFLGGMVDWLNQTAALRVHIAVHGTPTLSGHAYIAPDDCHLAVDAHGCIALARTACENGLRPAVSYTFRSLANLYGVSAIGVLLTGMGTDGAAELKQMRDGGAHTIAQDSASSAVHGMPGHAIQLGGAVQILPADKIAGALISQVERSHLTAGELKQ
jgi:two-component system, chemotaxis family, protein-glutamate methylesterase/glutaminase